MWKELIKRYIIYGLLMIIALRFVSWISLNQDKPHTINTGLFWLQQLVPSVLLLTAILSAHICLAWLDVLDRRLGVLRAFALAMGFGFGIFGLLVFVLAFCSLFKFYLGTIIAVPLFLFLKSKKVPPLPQATRF